MDPAGPWSAYAPYNRLAAGVQASGSTGDLHHHLTTNSVGVIPATTTGTSGTPPQLLPGSFLSPPPVTYETVFSPLFHHAAATANNNKTAQAAAAHYVQQQRALAQIQAVAQSSKQTATNDNDYHSHQTFFEQNSNNTTAAAAAAAAAAGWQANSPFGILPHETVVATNNKVATTYENFNAHFAAAQSLNHLNSQLAKNVVVAAAAISRSQSPQISVATTTSKTINNNNVTAGTFFQVPTTFNDTVVSSSTKSFNSSTSNLQQSCIVSTAANNRLQQQQANRVFLTSPNPSARSTTNSANKQTNNQQIQTKAQTKIYPELTNQTNTANDNTATTRQRTNNLDESQSSPISFSIMDAPGRLNYSGSNNSAGNSGGGSSGSGNNKRNTQQQQQQFQTTTNNYRHYSQNNEQDFQRSNNNKSNNSNSSDYNSNGPDCNVVIPRRPSPLQAHSQASPIGHAASPAYPMYNSPMSSISSPQQQNQITPPSPLDVSVPRANAQQQQQQTANNVAYPSVITRALNTNNDNKNFNEQRYERNQTNCWEEQRQRKFQTNNNNYNNSIEVPTRQQQIELNSRNDQTARIGLNITERQQAYFDTTNNSGGSSQVTLQDLSSCRGDPMSIVKNLQQQQSCQVPLNDIKQETKSSGGNKRRKSSEKVVINEIPGRLPPPAHSSGTNQQQTQQQQNGSNNGSYFDFDRWNLPPPTSKMFSSQTIHQQHQGLMVPHPHGHHPPPPLPYFTPFHIPPPPPHTTDFPTPVEITSLSSYNEQQSQQQQQNPAIHFQQQQQQHHHQQQQILHHHQQQQLQQQQQQQQQQDQPKVVVPNIEEELNFLSQDAVRNINTNLTKTGPVTNTISAPKVIDNKPIGSGGGGSGFMSSYLKFLQGERDSSPPPAVRGGRKQSWTKINNNNNNNKPQIQSGDDNLTEINGLITTTTMPTITNAPIITTTTATTRSATQGDPQDDPRYFPLPKERKRNSFDSSDDGLSSDDDFFNHRKYSPPLSFGKEKSGRKSRPIKQSGPTERKRAKKDTSKHVKEPKVELSLENIPRRETCKRAAKEKSNFQQFVKNDDEPEEPIEFQDSDSDPAWTPQAKEDLEEPLTQSKHKKRGRPGAKTRTRNLITTAVQSAGIQENDGYGSDMNLVTKKVNKNNKNKQSGPPTLEDNIAASLKDNTTTPTNDNPYKQSIKLRDKHKTGEFVAIKSELNQEWPPIWRIDGKTLLQKYESFEQNGVTLYRNISTYTSWTPESRNLYISIPVRCKSHNQLETIVEFLRHEMTIIDADYQEKCMKDCEIYQDNFEVYIQTLISQALDSNFLTEIFQEKDEYFLSNVKTIDEITENKKKKLLYLLRWPPQVQAAVCTWPCYNIIREVHPNDVQSKSCAACGKIEVAVRVLMYGQPYNSTTLEGCQPDPKAMNEKNFLMCRICANRVELSNKVTHQKYLMYIECAKRVGEKRTSDPNKDTTCILNELLADETWLNQLFLEVRTSWAEIDCIEYSLKMKNSIVHM